MKPQGHRWLLGTRKGEPGGIERAPRVVGLIDEHGVGIRRTTYRCASPHRTAAIRGGLVAVVSMLCVSVADARWCHAGQWNLDTQAYAVLVDADSPQTIPIGTRIGAGNWRQYKKFLPVGIQALFSGAYQFRVPKGQDAEMVVGPTIPIPAPFKYQRDTEQYAGMARLVRKDGEVGISGYVAGLPFPDLRQDDVDLVYKLIYDAYFHYHPAILYYRQHGLLFDTYLNRNDTIGTAVEFRLNHISDVGYPLSEPLAPAGVFFTSNFTVEAPEQSKYTVNLQIYYDEPNRLQDIYTYIPSLRRSVRRSSAARCAPIFGTDIVQDDVYPRPILLSQFAYKVLGHKKLLFQTHLDPAHLFEESSYNLTGAPGWPKPILGSWELRNVWIVEERTLPANADYCYGSRVSYFDSDQFLSAGLDIYDRNLKLWKIFNSGYAPGTIGDGHGSVVMQGNTRSMTLDLLNSHATASIQLAPGLANRQVPEKYRDVQVWALPAGLPQMNP